MIPTRADIVSFADVNNHAKTTSWLRAMRDEIDRLTDANTDLRDKVDDTDGRIAAMEIHGNSADHWYRKATAYKNAFSERDAALAEVTKLRHEIDRLQADIDRANTEAALARDAMAKATTDTRAKVQNELRSVERALCSADVLIKYAAWSRGAYECHVKNTIETAIDALRDDSATTPYSPPFEGDPKDCAFKASDPVREEEIKAWRDWALGDIADPDLYDDCFVLSRAEIDSAVALMRSACPKAPETPKLQPSEDREAAIRAWEEEALTVESGEEPFGQGYFLLRRSEITAAVALMRSADGKALLRELRAWIIDEKWCAPGIVRKIDEMLAQPAPVEQPAPPAAAVPDDIGLGPVTDEMVQSGIAAVKDGRWITLEQLRKELAPAPDDTRELVAQLGHFVCMMLKGEANRAEVRDIIAKMRGGA